MKDEEIFSRLQTAREETEGNQYTLKPSEDINVTLNHYMANILEPLLLNLDIVTLNSSQEDLLKRFHFHNDFVREIQDRKIIVRQSFILATKSIPTILSYRRLVLFGDLTRLRANSKVKRLLWGKCFGRTESENFRRLCIADLQKFNITYETCKNTDRDIWIQTLDKKLSDLE
ncbi:hypothetical protein BgiMline_036908 [Biomphalaria glabrata]|nr:hypothetical protein BgiMline_015284 [Biomphalaria glabrata]